MTFRPEEPSLEETDGKYRHFIHSMAKGWVYHKIVTEAENKPVDYIFLEVNEAYERLTGLIKDEIIGKRVTEVLPDIEIDPADWIGRFGEVALSGNPRSFENYSEDLDRWYAVSVTCPEPGYFTVVLDDITERKQREKNHQEILEKLHYSHELMQYIISHARSAIAVHDRDLNYVYVSDRYLQIYSVEEKNVIGKHHYEVFPDLPQKWRDVHQRCLNGEVISAEEDSYARNGGSVAWTRWECRPWYEADNSIGGIIVYIEDITEHKQAEEQRLELEKQLHQKHKMEAIGYMAGGMAHNFNNNLSIILGNVELAQIKQARNSDAIPLLENVQIAVRRSRDLIQKIITYSRQGIQQKVPMQLTTITDETHGLLRLTIPTTIDFQKIISPECDSTFINADASQIQEVLVNLCNNAIQAMEEKGELTIQLEPVELTQQDIPAQYDCLPGRYAKLRVQDNGCGMPAEMLDKIFDPFYTTKEEYEGAGMGLATVQGIVAQHGGCIKVNSIPDQGTVFNLYFPIIEQTHIDEPTAEDTTFPEGTERILFVDDDEILANLGQELLSEMGYQVTTMTDSTEALKMFVANADHFDLVVTDQTMPELTGQELIQELRKIRPNLAVILCTGYSSKVDADIAEELEINAFLMKPLGLDKLAQTVRRVLDEVEEE